MHIREAYPEIVEAVYIFICINILINIDTYIQMYIYMYMYVTQDRYIHDHIYI
jgi:hypothetical protein